MLTSLQMTNFRQFEDLTIEPLARVNLIAGSNGTGKTSILEALYLLFMNQRELNSFPKTFREGQGHEGDFSSFWSWLNHRRKKRNFKICGRSRAIMDVKVTLSQITPLSSVNIQWQEGTDTPGSYFVSYDGSAGSNGRTGRSNSTYWPSVKAYPTRPLNPFEDAKAFNQVNIKRSGKERLTELLKIVEPHLSKLEYVKIDTPEPVIYAELDMDDLIPATQLGQGFSRLLRIFSGILASEAKIVLIDEIENGLHWTALEQVWRGIAELTRQHDVQVFATTHSLECIRAAHNVFAELANGNGYGDGFALHRLDRKKDGGVKLVTYDQETLQTSFDQNWEVR